MKYALRTLFFAVGLLGFLPDLVLAQVDSGGGAAPLSVDQDSQAVGQLVRIRFSNNTSNFFCLELQADDAGNYAGCVAPSETKEVFLRFEYDFRLLSVEGGTASFTWSEVPSGADTLHIIVWGESLNSGDWAWFWSSEDEIGASTFAWAVWTGFGFGALTAFLTFGRRLLARVATPVFSE